MKMIAMTRWTWWMILCVAVVGFAEPALSLTYELTEGTVKAKHGEKIVWENSYFYFSGGAKAVSHDCKGPIQAGKYLYYVVGRTVFQARPDNGVIRRRVMIPGKCTSLEADGDKVVIKVVSDGDFKWERTYTISSEACDIPFLCPTDHFLLRMASRVASAVIRKIISDSKRADPLLKIPNSENDWKNNPVMKPFLEKAVRELDTLARRDSTNPWFRLNRGVYLDMLGRAAEASIEFRKALNCDKEYHFELLGMAQILDKYDSSLGDEAFDKAMRFYVSHGYEPELNYSLAMVMWSYGAIRKSTGKLDPIKDVAVFNRNGGRLWDLAPFCERACFFYKGLELANERAGNAEISEVWRERVRHATPYHAINKGLFERPGHALTLMIATCLAGLLLLIVRNIKYVSTFARALKTCIGDRNIFAYWTRQELIGLLLIVVSAVYLNLVVVRGVVAIGHFYSIPRTTLEGFLGHPDTVKYLKQFGGFRGSDSGEFVYAVLLQKSGDLDGADAIYQKLGTAQALNNRGVIALQKRGAVQANQMFEQALQKDSTLAVARYNLSELAESPQITRMRKYQAIGPLLSLPAAEQWGEALAQPGKGYGLISALGYSLISLYENLSWLTDSNFNNALPAVATILLVALIAFYLLIILSIFMIIALFQKPRGREYQWKTGSSIASWALGFIFPGAARQWGILGPVVTSLFFSSIMIGFSYLNSSGTGGNIFEGTQVFTAFFGLSVFVSTPLFDFMVGLRHLWWILLIVNLVYLICTESVLPDPLGARGKSAPERKPE